MVRVRLAFAALLLLALIPAVGAEGGIDEMGATLPSGRYATAAAWAGDKAYVFGGQDSSKYGPSAILSDILVYDPVTDEVAKHAASLPRGYAYMGAASNGPHVYLFGGFRIPDDPGATLPATTDRIWRFDPAQATVAEMQARLPTPRYNVAAVWDGSAFLLFGGTGCGNPCPVLRYNPSTDQLQVRQAAFDVPRIQGAAVMAGPHAYYLGGRTPENSTFLDEVWRYDRATDSLHRADPLSVPRMWAPGVWDGSRIHLLGGSGNHQHREDTVLAYDPVTGRSEVLPLHLPAPSTGLGAVWAGDAAYAFGGGPAFDRIYRFVPGEPSGAPAAPTPSEDAEPGTPRPGEQDNGSSGQEPTDPGSAEPTPSPGTPQAPRPPAPLPHHCDPRPRNVEAGVGGFAGREAWVAWEVPLDCPAPSYVVWSTDGRLLAQEAGLEGHGIYTALIPRPPPGTHHVLVQAAGSEVPVFDAEQAVGTELRVPAPAAPQRDEAPLEGKRVPMPLGLVAVLGLLALRRRRR